MEDLISIIIPSRDRLDGLIKAIHSIQDTTQGYNVEIIAVLDEPDIKSITAVKHMHGIRLVVMPSTYRNGHPQEKWQEGYKATQGNWIIMATDDAIFRPGWLKGCLETPNKGFIGIADSNWVGILAQLCMATREYIETVMNGRFGLPWYYVEWADNEWTARARQADRIAFCPKVGFDHIRNHDSQRKLTESYPEKDAATYHAREKAGFPEEWPIV